MGLASAAAARPVIGVHGRRSGTHRKHHARALPGYADQKIALLVAGKRSRFDVCRISFRKTGVHFSGKCSKVTEKIAD